MSDGTMNTEVPISDTGVVYHLGVAADDLADCILLVGDPGRVPFVASFFDDGSIRCSNTNREVRIITGTYKGLPITAMSTGMGTDNVEIVMTEIHILKEYNFKEGKWGPRKVVNIIRCGTCGCPLKDVVPGTLAVTHLTLGLDNTGKFYSDHLAQDSPNGNLFRNPAVAQLLTAVSISGLGYVAPYVSTAHPSITHTLETLGNARKRPVVVGHTASAPGFYACQGRKVGRLSDLRYPDLPETLAEISAAGRTVVNIEMETSSLCHIGHILGYRCGTVCVVLANRADGKGNLLPDSEKVQAMTDCVLLALDTFLMITGCAKL